MANKPKIVLVSGAYPDIGKGIFSASLCYLLQEEGLSAYPIKFDGYMNYSSGTMNPYHGGAKLKYAEEEVFTLDDGYEGDADSGYYERFTHKIFTNKSNITNGRLFGTIRDLENSGKVKHGEILNYRFIRQLLSDWIIGASKHSDITVLEVGGTIGDKEAEIIFDTLNLLESQGKIFLYKVMLSPYFIEGKSSGFEMSYRSKITRQGFEKSWRMGVTPNSIILRTPKDRVLLPNDIALIGVETGLDPNDIYTDPDLDCIYDLPQYLQNQDISKKILNHFGLKAFAGKKTKVLEKYAESLRSIRKKKKLIKIGIFGKTVSDDSYISLKEAVEHAGVSKSIKAEIIWLDESKNYKKQLGQIDALIVGEGLNQISDKINALKYARENKIPCLGISFGCNLQIKEFFESKGQELSIEELNEKGHISIERRELRTGAVNILFSRSDNYRTGPFNERIRHRSLYSESAINLIKASDFRIIGSENKTEQPVMFELKGHPYYVGCMFHPEYISHPGYPHSLFVKLIERGIKNKYAR